MLGIASFLDFSHSNQRVVISHVVLICNSLMNNHAEHLNICLFANSITLRKVKCLFISFANFLNWALCLLTVGLQQFFVYFR